MRIAMLCLLLAGCATVGNYRKRCESWVGKTQDELVAGWGVPARSIATSDGGQVLEFVEERGATAQANQFTHTVDINPRSCQTTFTVGPDHRVKAFRFYGNLCRAKKP